LAESAAKLHLLIVEDDSDLSEALSEYLERDGLDVTTGDSCAKALELLKAPGAQFQMLLTDLLLPDGDGFEVIKAAKERNPKILAAVMTGYASLKTAVEAIRLGAYDYITKPFTLEQIDILVRNMRDKISLEQELREDQQRLRQVFSAVEMLQDEKRELIRLNREVKREFDSLSRKMDQVLELLHRQTGKDTSRLT
jgi:two-component system response regulator PilR (NtrC family)